jgi:fucokinase
MPEPFVESRLLILYTGKPRLAKNLLQNVIRNWYSQEPDILAAFAANLRLAATCWAAVRAEDLAALAACLDRYWRIKRALAPGAEPELVQRILAALRPLILGASLAGAGGGGFLVAILKVRACFFAFGEKVFEPISEFGGYSTVWNTKAH